MDSADARVDFAVSASVAPIRPRLRGRLHQLAFLASIPAGVVAVATAATTRARVGVAVYAASLAALYAASGAYHWLVKDSRAKRVLRRIDHSMIYVLIAGSTTPVALLALDGAWALALVVATWAGALGGVVLKVVSRSLSGRFGSALYFIMGWAVLLALPQLVRGLTGGQLTLLLTGASLYTAGAIVLLRRRPDPVPAWFGYHELWHCFVVVAGVCHYALVFQLGRAA